MTRLISNFREASGVMIGNLSSEGQVYHIEQGKGHMLYVPTGWVICDRCLNGSDVLGLRMAAIACKACADQWGPRVARSAHNGEESRKSMFTRCSVPSTRRDLAVPCCSSASVGDPVIGCGGGVALDRQCSDCDPTG